MRTAPLALLLALLFACGGEATKEGHEAETAPKASLNADGNSVTLTPAQQRNTGVRIGPAMADTAGGAVTLAGVIEVPPQNVITVHAPVAGYVLALDLLPGMHVHKGETLTELDSPELLALEQDYLNARVRQQVLKQDYDRQAELATAEVAARKVYEQAKADYDLAQIATAALAQKLALAGIDAGQLTPATLSRRMPIRAAAAGVVRSVSINPGKGVAAQEALFELQSTGHVHLELSAYETDAARIAPGQKVSFTLAGERRLREATVYLVGREVRADRTVSIHCHLADARDETQLLPGTFCTATVRQPPTQGQALPAEAFVQDGGAPAVFTVTPAAQGAARFTLTRIRKGAQTAGGGYLFTPINPHKSAERYAVSGAFGLLSALRNTAEE